MKRDPIGTIMRTLVYLTALSLGALTIFDAAGNCETVSHELVMNFAILIAILAVYLKIPHGN